jgi:hypothetical protein
MNKNPYFFVISIAVVAFMGCGFQEPEEDTSSSDTEIGEISTIVGPGLRHEPSADPVDPQNGGEPPYSQDPHGSGGEEGNDPQVAPAVDGGVGNDPTTSPSEEPVVDGGTAPADEEDPPAEEDPVIEDDEPVTFGISSVHVDALDAEGNPAVDVRSFGMVFTSPAASVVFTINEKATDDLFYVTTVDGPVTALYISPGDWTSTLEPETAYTFTIMAIAEGDVEGSGSLTYIGEFTTGNYPVEEGSWITPAVVSSADADDGTCTLHFGARYIGNADAGEVRGTIPGMSWGLGPDIEDLDGNDEDLEWTLDADGAIAGTYEISYVNDDGEWANFGDGGSIAATDPDFRGYVDCTWWDENEQETVLVSNPGCGLKVRVEVVRRSNGSKECTFSPAGNMYNYTGE